MSTKDTVTDEMFSNHQATSVEAHTRWGVVRSRLAARLEIARTDERGQTTAEYALVLLGVAAIAMLVLAWAGQTDTINGLFDAVMASITSLVP